MQLLRQYLATDFRSITRISALRANNVWKYLALYVNNSVILVQPKIQYID